MKDNEGCIFKMMGEAFTDKADFSVKAIMSVSVGCCTRRSSRLIKAAKQQRQPQWKSR
ncbi:hypothetical protein [Desulfosporosinus fructosivorans]